MYTRCTDRFARILANHSVPTYEYLFEYRGQYSIVNLQGEQVDMGIAHGDELQYIFSGIWGDDLSMSPSDTKFSKNIFTPLLTNFAKTRFFILLLINFFYRAGLGNVWPKNAMRPAKLLYVARLHFL